MVSIVRRYWTIIDKELYISNICQIQIPRFIKGGYSTANLGKFYSLEGVDNKFPLFQNNISIGRKFSIY